MLCSTRNLNNTTSIAEASKQLGTALPTPNTQVRRDASGGVSVATLTASAIESNADTLNIATANNTQTVNLGSGTGVQTINIGNSGAGATTINIGGVGDSVNVAGTLTNINSTTTNVLDKTFVLNSGGLAASAGSSGIYFEEAGVNTTNFMRIASDRTKFELKAPAGSLITLDQSVASTDTPTFGSLGITKTIAFPGAEVRKRISLYDDGTPSDQNDHRFNGFGKGNYTHVYQIKATLESHVFYAATSATTSNELLRIAGSGAITAGGSLTAGSIISNGGAAITGAVTVASGGITVQNGVSCSALTTSYVIFPSGTLSYYEEYDHLTTFNIPGNTTLAVTIRFTRIGRQVTAHIPALVMTNPATLTTGIISSTTAFPARFRSANTCYAYVSVNNDSLSPVSSAGCVCVTTIGTFEVRPTTSVSSYSINGAYNFGFSSFTATWTV